jgi:hypothetical protein
MKKIIFVLGICLTLNACNKTTEQNVINTSIKKTRSSVATIDNYQHSFLVFDDRDELDATLDQIKNYSIAELDAWSSNQEFVNARQYFEMNPNATNNNSVVDNEILYSIMNKDGIVQIGNFVYMHDLNSGLVWSMNSNNLTAHISNFINHEFNATYMNKFNLEEEDIIEKAETGIVGLTQKKLRGQTQGLFGIDNHPTPITYTQNGGSSAQFTFDWKASYQNLGILKSLEAKLRHYPGTANSVTFNQNGSTLFFGNLSITNAPVLMSFSVPPLTSVSFKPRKQNTVTLVASNFPAIAVTGKQDIRPYSNTKALDKINLNVSWQATDNNGNQQTFNVTIAK